MNEHADRQPVHDALCCLADWITPRMRVRTYEIVSRDDDGVALIAIKVPKGCASEVHRRAQDFLDRLLPTVTAKTCPKCGCRKC